MDGKGLRIISSRDPVLIDGIQYELSQDMVKLPKEISFNKKIMRNIIILGGFGGFLYSPTFRSGVSLLCGVGLISFSAVMVLMKFSKRFKNKMISIFIPSAMVGMDKMMKNVKNELLRDIKGDVLDFGAGGGPYLNYINKCKDKVDSIVSLEPCKDMHPLIRKLAEKLELNVEIVGKFSSQLLKERGPNQFDFIILGNVLCEVPDQVAVLKDVFAMLKPSGKVFFLEHITHPKGTTMRRVEELVNPFWNTFSGGCNCNRDTLKVMKTLPWNIFAWQFEDKTMPLIGGHIAGFLTKSQGLSTL